MKYLQFTLAVMAVMVLAVSANAGSIAVSFAGDIGGGTAINVGAGTAGVVPQSNWNNGTGASGGLADLLDDSGAATTADVDWTSANTWGGSSFTDANEAVINGWLDDGGDGAQVTVTEIPYDNYDVIVYFTSDVGNNGRGHTLVVNGTQKDTVGLHTNLNPRQTFYNGLADGSVAAEDPTYMTWTGQSGDLSIVGDRDGDNRRSISGFQIIESTPIVPEPTSFVLSLGAIALGCVARRRS